MGSICSKLCPHDTPRPWPGKEDLSKIKFSDLEHPDSNKYQEEPEPVSPVSPISRTPPIRQVPNRVPSPPTPQNDESCVQLHTPIYVGVQSYQTTKTDQVSFERGDEMELIEEINSSQLRVRHLRSGLLGIVPKEFVRLDVDTPLRLAIREQGVLQRCLMHYNVPGAYLIRHSATSPNSFVLSISQYNEQHNTFTWNYLISVNSSNRCFYFSQQGELKNMFFSSLQQLVADERVRDVIPLTEILPYSIEFDEDVWKIPYHELKIEQKIGAGQFGEVSRGTWCKGRRTISVAIKKLHIYGVNNIVEREIEAMKKLTNLYIVSLFGISQNPTTNEILIVTALMENGDLKSWLTELPTLPEYSTLLRFSKDIASGMGFLELRNYVHRDLACRNILLGSCHKRVRIADFGLSTIVDTGDTDRRQEAHAEKLPTRWLAPELLDNQTDYSVKSDVWSFGIVLIELWLKGENPYGEEHRVWIQAAVSAGYVHPKPDDCPDDVYDSIICQCLKFQANDRPSFSRLRQLLEKLQD